jgi:hypothetical protein
MGRRDGMEEMGLNNNEPWDVNGLKRAQQGIKLT